jgi:hypothetical protein
MGKFIDLSGQRFNRLVVIKKVVFGKNKRFKWLCKCDCGNEVAVIGSALKLGKTRSCGCYNKDIHRFTSIAGLKFNRLTAIEPTGKTKNGIIIWRCLCECGNETSVPSTSLRNQSIKSCGCFHKEVAAQQGASTAIHGMSNSRLYRIWGNMKSRCYNKNASSFEHYGARGIQICESWINDFQAFLKDMGPTFKKGLTLDRIDVNGNYEPSNCRWASTKEQSRNKTNNRVIETPWGNITLAEAAENAGISMSTLFYRLQRNCDKDKLFKPTKPQAELYDRVNHL